MTFSDLKTQVKDYLNLTSTDADTRVGKSLNRHYRRVTSQIGLDATRFVTRTGTTTNGVATVTFTSIEKIDRLIDATDSGALRLLPQVGIHEIRSEQPSTGQPTRWALQSTDDDAVTIRLDTLPQTTYSLQADGWTSLSDLTANDEPAFPESFHDILAWFVIAEELLKKQQDKLAREYERRAEKLLADLRFHLADSHTRTTRQGISSTPGAGGSSGSSNNGGSAYTQTGLITFDRDPDAPFAVTASSAVVTNLDADKLDGLEGSAYGVVSGKLSQFAATTSSELAGVISDETGSGALVFGTSPTIVTPTIASFANATHTHENAAGGGTLGAAAIASGTVALARGGTNADLSATSGVLIQASGGANVSTEAQLAVARGGTGVATNAANQVFAGPTSGGAAAPAFRALVTADLPTVAAAAHVYHSTTEAVTTSANLSFNSEDVDQGGLHDTVTNNSRLTIPSGAGGIYLVMARVWVDSVGTSSAHVFIRKNGTTKVPTTGTPFVSGASTNDERHIFGVISLAAADYIEVYIEKGDSSSWTFGSTADEAHNFFCAVRIGG